MKLFRLDAMLAPLASFALTAFAGAATSNAAETYRWVQFVPAGVEARVVTDAATCPTARIDGADVAMAERSAPGPGYPVRGCAVAIPSGAKALAVDGVPLTLPSANPQKIVVLGDTGCRMKGKKVQACNDVNAWPFRLVAEVIAAMKPDLVIHVGDYHYRETACPDGNLGCAGSPYGDNWAVWRADFFGPAENLLRTVPWMPIRGNHEECNRGGKGWSRTLEAYAFNAAAGCNTAGEPFVVTLPGLTLGVLDVSTAEEEKINPQQAATFRAQMQALAPRLVGPSWLLMHRPAWSVEEIEKGQTVGDNRTLAAAFGDGALPSNVGLMLSGHHHTFQVFNYASDLPTQVISGHGGDYLDDGAPINPAGFVVNGVTVKSGINQPKAFGFSMFQRGANSDWSLTNHDAHGKIVASCSVKHRSVDCVPVGG